MPPGLDPGGFQSQGEFSDAVGLATGTIGFSLSDLFLQAQRNEGANPSADYPTVTTTGGTVAYDGNKHSGTQSLRITRTSNAQVGVVGNHVTGGVLQNGDAGMSFTGSFWLYANSLPSTSVNCNIASLAMSAQDNPLLTLNNLGELRISRQNNFGVLSPASATLITTGQWYQISWMMDFTSANNMHLEAWVNQDTPVELNYSSRIGNNDLFLDVKYGTMETSLPGASNYDLCFDDGVIYRIDTQTPLLLNRTTNETASITNTEYDNLITTGGTVAYSTAQFHEGTQSVRVNRTSANPVAAESRTFTQPNLGPGGLQHAALSGSFWIYVASYPSGVGDTPIFTIYHPVGSNVDISLSNTGQVRMRQQDGNLSASGAQSSYSATTVALNTWTQIFWTMDGTTGTLLGSVAVGSDTPQMVSWNQAAEVPPWMDFGCKVFAVASNYDIYYDDAYVYEGVVYPVTFIAFPTFPNVASHGVGTADETALQIKLPNRTSAGTATTSANNIKIRLPNVSSAGTASSTTATGLKIKLSSRTSAGSSTSTATALLIKLPNRTSAGVGTTSQAGLKILLPSRTSAGTSNITTTGLRIQLPARTSAGTGATSQAGLKIKLPSRTSVGTSTATATAIRILLPNRTLAGTSNLTQSGLKILLPARTSAGTGTSTATNLLILILLPAVTSNGTSTATATALKIKLPGVTSAGTSNTQRTYSQTITADAPKSWWRLDETSGTTATDSIGTNNGTYSGTIGYNQPSLLPAGGGTSIDFGNSLGKINVGDVFDFVGNVSYSVECWVRFSDLVDASARYLVSKQRTSPSRDGWGMGFNFAQGANQQGPKSGVISWQRWNNTTASVVAWPSSGAPNIQPGKQYHLVGTYDGSTLRLYINGVLVNTGSASATIIDITEGLAIAAFNTATGSSSKEVMDEVAIYDYVLSASQIRSHYSAGNGYALQIKIPNVTSAGTSNATATGLKIKLPAVNTGPSAGANLAFDHGVTGSASANTVQDLPTTRAVVSGNYLVITGTSSSGTATIVSIAVQAGTDPGDLSWTIYSAQANATGAFVAFTRCPTGVNNNVTFRVTWSGVAFGTRRLGLTEWNGLVSSSVEDTHNSATSSVTGDPSVSLTTSAQPGELIVAGLSEQTATTFTPNTGWTEIHDDNGGSRTHSTIYQVVTSTGTYTPGSDAASNNHWAIVAVALKASPAGGSGSNAIAQPLNLGLHASSAGVGTASATALLIKLPSRSTAGVGSLTGNNVKIKLPNRTVSGTSTATATNLSISGGNQFFPSVTSAGSSTATAAALRIRLPSRTSSGTSSPSALGLRIRLPNRSTAGTSSFTQAGIQIRLPSRTSAGTSNITQAGIRDRIALATSAGSSNATAQAFRIKLPARTSAGQASTIAGALVGGMMAVQSHGTSTTSQTALKIRLPARTSAGTSNITQAGLRDRIALATSTGTSSTTCTGFRIRLPGRSSSGASTLTTTGLRIRLPSRTSSGSSSAQAQLLHVGFHSILQGGSNAIAQAFQIRLPYAQADGTSSIFGLSFLYIPPPDKVVIAGSSTHTATVGINSGFIMGEINPGSAVAGLGDSEASAGDTTKTVRVGP
jgi:concanavalin A-like lectin/glucanase superfamily protein